jgi:hypothetical protein
MRNSSEHVEVDGQQRLERQRTIATGLPSEHPDTLLLETLERSQVLLVQQLKFLRERQKRL